jgi:hypothetical protein
LFQILSSKDLALHGLLPDGRSDERPSPFHILWQPNIDRDHSIHADLLGLTLQQFIVFKAFGLTEGIRVPTVRFLLSQRTLKAWMREECQSAPPHRSPNI